MGYPHVFGYNGLFCSIGCSLNKTAGFHREKEKQQAETVGSSRGADSLGRGISKGEWSNFFSLTNFFNFLYSSPSRKG